MKEEGREKEEEKLMRMEEGERRGKYEYRRKMKEEGGGIRRIRHV